MLVTYSNVTDANSRVVVNLAAKSGRITRIVRVNGVNNVPTLLGGYPFLSITNCMNADGTAFTARYQAEEESTSGTFARQARATNFDPPWHMTIVPGQATVVTYDPGIAGAGSTNFQLTVGYKYE